MLAGKWLAAMEPADALAETEQMTAVDMSAALSSMKGHQAAEIIQVSSLRPVHIQHRVHLCHTQNTTVMIE